MILVFKKNNNLDIKSTFDDVVNGDVEIKEAIYKTTNKNIDVMPAKKNNDLGVHIGILGDALLNKMKIIEPEYDLILIKGAPLDKNPQALIIARVSIGVVLVVEYGKVSCIKMKNIKKLIDRSGEEILGAIFNKVSKKDIEFK